MPLAFLGKLKVSAFRRVQNGFLQICRKETFHPAFSIHFQITNSSDILTYLYSFK